MLNIIIKISFGQGLYSFSIYLGFGYIRDFKDFKMGKTGVIIKEMIYIYSIIRSGGIELRHTGVLIKEMEFCEN